MLKKLVLDKVKNIPKGKITTYKLLAHSLDTKAYRAVGNILNKNKHLVKIPCHRVVRSDSKIGGYAKGTKKKKELLKKEGITIKNNKIIDLKRFLYILKK